MHDDMTLLADLRPTVAAPGPEVRARSREMLLAKISAEPESGSGHPRFLRRHLFRRWIVPCLAIVGLGAAGVGLAGGLQDWWESAGPAVRPDDVNKVLDFGRDATGSGRVEPVLEHARTVARAPGMALVAAPTKEGNYCLVPVPDEGKLHGWCLGGNPKQIWTFGAYESYVQHGAEPAWYLYGRVAAEGAARIRFFERVTHPLERSDPETPPVTPIEADVAPGGFFLARVPEEAWANLQFAYGEITVLDDARSVLEQSCRYFPSTPISPLSQSFNLTDGLQLTSDQRASNPNPCPDTGAAVDNAELVPVQPRTEADLTGVTSTDVVTGETIALARYLGRPLLIAVWDRNIFTAWQFLEALDVFAERHPDVQMLGVLRNGEYGRAVAAAFEKLGLTFPTIVLERSPQRPPPPRVFIWDGAGGFGLSVLALDAEGRIAAELATSDPHMSFNGILTQKALEDVLGAAD
jgi:hypothetical protein